MLCSCAVWQHRTIEKLKWLLHCLFAAILTLCKRVDISTGHLLKLTVCDRYNGVQQLRSGKFKSRIWANGKNLFFGVYATESEAARAVDEAHIYRVSFKL